MAFFRKLYDFFSSSKLALSLLVLILTACLVAAVFLPREKAAPIVFSSLWFNGLLVLLVVNTAFCFFPRIWRKKLTLVSTGLIIFHLSFILIFIGIVYDSLYFFRGEIRLTEGESLSISEPRNYDNAEWGRFFNHDAKLKGNLTFHKLEPRHQVEDKNKGVANEITVSGSGEKRDFIYVTRHLNFNGLKFYQNKDGFSPLIVLRDRKGNVVYGAYAPIQSLKQAEKVYSYTTGTAQGPGPIPFPQDAEKPLFDLQFEYYPDSKKDREGCVFFRIRPYEQQHGKQPVKELFKGRADFGQRVKAGDYLLSMEEVRFWASMTVRYNPGLPLILASFWVGLGGLIVTAVARFRVQ